MRAAHLLIPAFILILLIPSLLAVTPEEQLRSLGYLTLIPVAFMIVLVIIGIAYMLSKLLSLPQLDAWCRMELGELLISVLIVVIIFAIVGGANSIVNVLTGEDDYIKAANGMLDRQITNMKILLDELVQVNYAVSKYVGFSFTGSLNIIIVVPYWSSAPNCGMMPLSVAIMSALDSVSLAILVTASEKLFLNFFSKVVLIYLLPIALVLRTFPFTRRIGAALIALSLGVYIIFPFSIIIAGGIFDSIRGDSESSINPSNMYEIATNNEDIQKEIKKSPPGKGVICNKFNPLFTLIGEQGWCTIICSWILATLFGAAAYPICCFVVHILYWTIELGFGLIMTPALRSYASVELSTFYDPLYNIALPAVTMSVLLSIVLYLIVIIFTIIGTKSIAAALGGEAQLYGLEKLI